jgi:hypothetical protein
MKNFWACDRVEVLSLELVKLVIHSKERHSTDPQRSVTHSPHYSGICSVHGDTNADWLVLMSVMWMLRRGHGHALCSGVELSLLVDRNSLTSAMTTK